MIRKYAGTVLVPNDTAPQPPVFDELAELKAQLITKDIDTLKQYANENGVDIGNATSQNGIYKKIAACLDERKKKDGQ